MIYLAYDNAWEDTFREFLAVRFQARCVSREIFMTVACFGDTLIIVGAVQDCPDMLQWQKLAAQLTVRSTTVTLFDEDALIGPSFEAGATGCVQCLFARYFGGKSPARRFAELSAEDSEFRRGPLLSAPLREAVAELLCFWLSEECSCNGDLKGGRRMLSFNLATYECRETRLVPDPNCQECSALPLDAPARAQVIFSPHPKTHAADDRIRSLKALGYVHDLYVGGRTNIVPTAGVRWAVKRSAVVTVGVPLSSGRAPEPCSGFSPRYSDADTAAVLEGLERYAGVRPRGYSPAIFDTRSRLTERSLNPRNFGLHSPEAYEQSPNLLTPYSDDLRIKFIWAHSFALDGPVLVPQQLAYYSLATEDEPIFVVEGSLGCALGSCPEECILHGIYEVIERDAFLMTWYARISPPPLNLTGCMDPEIRHYIRGLRSDGYDVFAFDITNDLAVPAIWLTAQRSDDGLPHSVSVSAAHLVPEHALKKAFRELIGILCRYEMELLSPKMRERVEELSRDPSKVRTMMDHALLYCSPDAEAHLRFLFLNPSETCLEDMSERVHALLSDDLTEDLRRVISLITGLGLDVVTVDQTTPEQLTGGFRTFKTLIPGAIPMSWGEHLRRTKDISRLDRAVARQGMTNNGAGANFINPAPHPFP